MEAIRSFGLSKKLQNQGYFLTGLMLLLFIAGLIILKKVIILFLVLAVLKLTMVALNSTHKIIKIFPKHFEIKLGVAGSAKLIKNQNFQIIRIENKKILIDYIDNTGKRQTVKMLKTILEEEDLTIFINFLESIKQDQENEIPNNILQKA
ncbi:hypothetical protein GCM10022393_13020 [Aquimarina addita]|uniref:Uncharacterized protein n=1 Tax=Aquimarina addita TaxID=870485 RepID=A0ABP7XFA1_9FLAO